MARAPGHARVPSRFAIHFGRENIDTGEVAAWPGKASDKTKLDRVFRNKEDDGDRLVAALAAKAVARTSGRGDHGDLLPNEFGCERRQLIH